MMVMTNLEYLRSLPLEEFAALLIYFENGCIYSADNIAWADYQDALDHTIKWLQEEYKVILN